MREGRLLHFLRSRSDSQLIRGLDLEDLVVEDLFAGGGFDAGIADCAADCWRDRAVLRGSIAANSVYGLRTKSNWPPAFTVCVTDVAPIASTAPKVEQMLTINISGPIIVAGKRRRVFVGL